MLEDVDGVVFDAMLDDVSIEDGGLEVVSSSHGVGLGSAGTVLFGTRRVLEDGVMIGIDDGVTLAGS